LDWGIVLNRNTCTWIYEGRFFVAVNICVFHPDKISVLDKIAVSYHTQCLGLLARTAKIELAEGKHVYALFLQDMHGGQLHHALPVEHMREGHFMVGQLPAMDLDDMRAALREERAMIIQQSQDVLGIKLTKREKFKLAVMGVVAKTGVFRTRDPFKVKMSRGNNVSKIMNPPIKPSPYPPLEFRQPWDRPTPRP
jgi:hypothetical protein